jgi:HSP20 family protein
MDIVETKDAFELHADAPGFTPEDINVQMQDGVLTISGKRQEEKHEEQGGKVVRRERFSTTFTRSFTLPENVKEDAITAKLDKGVLKVTVPRTKPAPKPEPKRITVAGGA